MIPQQPPHIPVPIVKAAVLATVTVISLTFLMLAFLGRYLEQRAVLASLTPALVSSDIAVVSSALDLLRETVSASRFQRFEQIARQRVKEMVNAKWNNPTLTPQALTRLQTTLDAAEIFSKPWIRDLPGYEREQQRRALGKLKQLIALESALPDQAATNRLLDEGQAALLKENCRTALSSFNRARQDGNSDAAKVGLHLSHLCFLGETIVAPPDKG